MPASGDPTTAQLLSAALEDFCSDLRRSLHFAAHSRRSLPSTVSTVSGESGDDEVPVPAKTAIASGDNDVPDDSMAARQVLRAPVAELRLIT